MKLEWIGHACFRLTAENGTVIVTDPYDDSVGIRVPKLTADLVTVSHEHHDHNNLDIVEGRPKVAREARAAQVGGVTTQAVSIVSRRPGRRAARAEQHPHLLYRRAQGGAHGRSGLSARRAGLAGDFERGRDDDSRRRVLYHRREGRKGDRRSDPPEVRDSDAL